MFITETALIGLSRKKKLFLYLKVVEEVVVK